MKTSHILILGFILNSYSATSLSGSINDNYATGDILSAQHLDNIKDAVNDNNEAIILLNSRISGSQPNLPSSSCSGFSYVQGFDTTGNIICSTDIPGTGYSQRSPNILNNLATLEIADTYLSEQVYIISGVGVDIERIEQFIPNAPRFIPGLNMEHDLVIETSGADAINLKAVFDNPGANRSISLIIRHLDNSEAFRINMYEMATYTYTASNNGRTRFTFIQALNANNSFQFETLPAEAFGNNASNNPETDKLVEISGITSALFYPQVEVDYDSNLITLTYDITEGSGLLTWARITAAGTDVNRDISVIQKNNNVEVSRENFFEVFPISWEIFDGFGLYNKIQARIVISFDKSEVLNSDLPL